jgi:hypothetical protein
VLLHVPKIIELESPSLLLVVWGILVFGPESLVVDLVAGANVVLGVGEEVVRTLAYEKRATDPGVSDRDLRSVRPRAAHHLLTHELFCSCWSVLSA